MKKVLGLNGGFKASNMKGLAFEGIKIHILHLFQFFKTKQVILEGLAYSVWAESKVHCSVNSKEPYSGRS